MGLKKLFRQQKNLNPVDIHKPLENNGLKNAFKVFDSDSSEANLKKIIQELLKANFLVLMSTKEIKTQDGKLGNVIVEKGSVMKLLNCIGNDGEPYITLFTDWQEADLWLKKRDENIGGLAMDIFDACEFAKTAQDCFGIVINPGSTGWTLNRQQIENFVADYKR